MSTEKPDPKNPAEPPSIKTTKLPDKQEIPDEELEKASGGRMCAGGSGIPETSINCGPPIKI